MFGIDSETYPSASTQPQKAGQLRQIFRCQASKDADELQLVKREETSDGTILFVFGDEAAAAAHQKESTPEPEPEPEQAPEPEPKAQPESKSAEPAEQLAAAAASPPAESPAAAEGAEPEAAYEEARGKKVKEAVKEKPLKEGAETSGTVEEAHQDGVLANGLGLPDFEDEEDPDELLSDEDAPDLQDEIAKTLTSLKVKDLKEMCKDRKIRGYSSMRKSQLVRTLKPILAEES
ncbi:g3289 [Coccomyxa viridis]|uniref:G3289 protein n=1 Tax=Coccomyxa viridis TaxID=1274662 RepID=A0ABP1FMG7_9CHLO